MTSRGEMSRRTYCRIEWLLVALVIGGGTLLVGGAILGFLAGLITGGLTSLVLGIIWWTWTPMPPSERNLDACAPGMIPG